MASWICTFFGWLGPDQPSKYRRVRRQKSILSMELPTLPPKVMLSGPHESPLQPGTSRIVEQRPHFPTDKIVWVERYDGIIYGTRTGNMPHVQAKVHTLLHPEGILVYCGLETYEQAPNSLKAAEKIGEDWNWVKGKYGKDDRLMRVTKESSGFIILLF